MREEIVEILVKCKTRIGLAVLRIVCFVLCAICILLALQGGIVFFIAGCALGIAGYYAGSYSQVEYEYTFCEKEIDIDAIYSQSRRTHIITLDLTKMEALVSVKSDKMKEFENRQLAVKDFTSHNKETGMKYMLLYMTGDSKSYWSLLKD